MSRVYRRLEATVKAPDGRVRGIGAAARLAVALAVALSVALAAAGCAERTSQVARQELFNLSVGPLEDQVHVVPGYEQAGVWLSLSGGLFHVVNAPVRKVMRFSSFGDLLLLLYDPRSNPRPVGLAEPAADSVTTRLARSLPLGPLGRIAADSQGTMYVQERLAPDDWQQEDGVVRSHVVRRFDRTGAELGYLGREGVSGTPFGRVQRLLVTERDELFVVTPRRRLVAGVLVRRPGGPAVPAPAVGRRSAQRGRCPAARGDRVRAGRRTRAAASAG